MRVINEGHTYQLDNFVEKDQPPQLLRFVRKVPKVGTDELDLVFDGTTNEEVLSVLINRMEYLQGKFPCRENAIVITKLQEALMWLEKRTKDRQQRGVEGKHLS